MPVFKGWLSTKIIDGNEKHKVLLLDGNPLTNIVKEKFKVWSDDNATMGPMYHMFNGKVVGYYFICDIEVELKYLEKQLVQKMVGSLRVDYDFSVYSEYTGDYFNQELRIGGHDLVKELKTYKGKYLILKIKKMNLDSII